MQYVLNRGKELCDAYSALLGVELAPDLAEDIRQSYLNTGYMWHRANRLASAPRSCARVGDTYCLRGWAPLEPCQVSGLATLSPTPRGSILPDLATMFGLGFSSPGESLGDAQSRAKWTSVASLPDGVEYLNTEFPTTRGYWQPRRPLGRLGLCRNRDSPSGYRLWRETDGGLETAPLAEWRVAGGEYRRLALALRQGVGQRPTLTVRSDGDITYLNWDYLLPPAEQDLLELLTWTSTPPNASSYARRVERVIPSRLVSDTCQTFIHLGFVLQEDA
jgi:hypothetical protein